MALESAAAYRVIHPRVRHRRPAPLRWYRRNERNVLGLAGLVSFFALWQVGSDLGVIDDLFFSSPSAVFLAAIREVQIPRFWRDVQYSLTEVTVGFLASFVLAVPLGLAIGWYRRVSFAADPWLNFLNAIPRPALSPRSSYPRPFRSSRPACVWPSGACSSASSWRSCTRRPRASA